ncbi:MAG: stage III sporulation protein AF [Defluviitaleaceae bacterium]|nr:stage III sporulation protein AF [Defluviitaleaceae bacterium]
MPAFFDYLRNITYYLMFATMIGLFAPAGKYRKFVSLVLGFILLLLMIQPLSGFFGGRDIPVTQWFAGALQIPGTNGYADDAESAYILWRDTYLRGAFEAQLESQFSRLMGVHGFTVYSVEFEFYDFTQITSVWARLSRDLSQNAEPERLPLIRIQPPQIRPIQIGEDSQPCPVTQEAKTLISEFYNLNESHINVIVT